MSLFKLLFVVIILGLTACKPSNTVNAQLGSPEHIAGEFFQAIYNDKDLEKAQSMSTKEFANLIGSYGTARQVGRTLFNMSFDKVLINVNRSGRNLREQYDDQASIQLIFDGEFDNKRIQETRTVVLVRQRGTWLVNEVLADKFSTSIR